MRRDIYGGKDPRDLPAYTVTEASRYLDIARTTVSQWVKGRGRGEARAPRSGRPLVQPAQLAKPTLLSFNNLVELHVLAALRLDERIPMHVLREALDWVSRRLDVARPLLSNRFQKEKEGVRLFYQHIERLVNDVDGAEEIKEHLIDLTVDRGQVQLPDVLDAYLRRIERDTNGVPIRLFPVVLKDLENRPVAVDPRRSFGRPVVANTGVPTFALVERYQAGESVAVLAQEFRLDPEQVRFALRYEREAA